MQSENKVLNFALGSVVCGREYCFLVPYPDEDHLIDLTMQKAPPCTSGPEEPAFGASDAGEVPAEADRALSLRTH